MTLNLLKVLSLSIVGFSVYIILNRLFPEKVKSFEKDHMKNLKGGSKINLLNQIVTFLKIKL